MNNEMKSTYIKAGIIILGMVGIKLYGRRQYIKGGKQLAKEVEQKLNEDFEVWKKNKDRA